MDPLVFRQYADECPYLTKLVMISPLEMLSELQLPLWTGPVKVRLASAEGPWHHHHALPGRTAMREKVSDEICNCGHRKSQHEAIVCGWWNCNCKQFEPLSAKEPKRERKPFEEFPHAGDIMSADVAAQEINADVAAQEISADVAAQEISADVAAQEVEQLRSELRAAQEEIGRLTQLQDGNHILVTRLGAENNQLREALAEIKRLIEAILARP